MDLHTSENFWPYKNGLIQDYPSLQEDIKADVVIIGAGISGALVADLLCKEGLDVVVLDKRHVGLGSTAASTALLQYEIDTPLHILSKKVGVDHAVRSYSLCLKAINDLAELCKKYANNSDFEAKPSFQFTSFKYQLKDHQLENELRQVHNISKTHWLEPKEIKDKFGFSKLGGIFSEDGAEVDPFKLAHNLFQTHWRKNLRIFNNTEVVNIEHHSSGVTLTTEALKKIRAKKLVIACGYESQKYLSQDVEIQMTSYAIVSEVLPPNVNLWHKKALIWETSDPYIYVRTTADNRILIGGKDDDFYSPSKRDKNLKPKTKLLEKEIKKLFPHIPFKTDYKWAGIFCKTKDGLPYIGSIPERPNTYFALGFGGNGITFSVIASQIIRDLLTNKKNDDEKIFSFQR